ncbi:MAG: cation diffusion facilitator family transporter [Clostridium sp.]|nr:cation diffusion facilitator family transporter [Clostridium sp.]
MKDRERTIYRVTLTGSAVNFMLIVLKFVAGIAGRSSAMVADAVHSLSDFVTDVIVIVFVKVASKPRDASHEYGHGKYETFATMIIGIILILAGLGLMVDGISRIVASLKGEMLPCPGMIALVVALVSIVSKEWLYHYTLRAGQRVSSQAVVANAWHHRSDAISSAGTLAGIAGAMFLGNRWRILDPIAAVVVSLFIIKSGWDIMKPSINELLEGSLPRKDQIAIVDLVLEVDGIEQVHNLRTRRVGNAIAVDLHAKMDGTMTLNDAHAKASAAERAIRARYGQDAIINIHMEPLNCGIPVDGCSVPNSTGGGGSA